MTGSASLFDTLDRHQLAVAVVGFGVGLGLSFYHFVGLVIGGLLLGLGAATVRRAVGLGILFGLTVWAAFGASLLLSGRFAAYAATGDFFLLSGGIAIALPALAATVRGLR